MEQKKIKICLTENASLVLNHIGINPKEYSTAYGGESAGLDLYYMGEPAMIPSRNKWTAFGEKPILLPTGVRIHIPEGYVGLVKERSSIIKTGLAVRAGVIDPGFTGEIFVSLVNLGDRDTNIETGAKLPVQLVVTPCINKFETVDYSEYVALGASTVRKENQVGSTNQS
jgi:dUTP pyrophosphatase